jgi:hypothetical protein
MWRRVERTVGVIRLLRSSTCIGTDVPVLGRLLGCSVCLFTYTHKADECAVGLVCAHMLCMHRQVQSCSVHEGYVTWEVEAWKLCKLFSRLASQWSAQKALPLRCLYSSLACVMLAQSGCVALGVEVFCAVYNASMYVGC